MATSFTDLAGDRAEEFVDTAVGGAAMAADVVTRPERAVRQAYRRGEGTSAAVEAGGQAAVNQLVGLPGRVLRIYVGALRSQAQRDDAVGTVARGVLDALHGPAGRAARFWGEVADDTDVRKARRTRRAPRRPQSARSATRAAARTTQARAKRARGAARTSGSRARTQVRRSR